MQSTTPINAMEQQSGDGEPRLSERFNKVFSQSTLAFLVTLLAASFFFVADLLIPRGATPAIGYTLVVVLASRNRKRAIILGMVCLCTALTWIGYVLEPAGAPGWMSIFDRAMITMVLWLTFVLAWRRRTLIDVLAERTRALELAEEEVQSANQALNVANQELKHRNTELCQLNDDLSNLLAGVNLPIVMFGEDLQIRRFTAAAATLMNLVPTDVGCPLANIKPSFDMPDLESTMFEAIASELPLEREIKGPDGRWQMLRIHPYRTSTNQITGAILLLIDIDEMKKAGIVMQEARDVAEEANRTKDLFLAMLSHELRTPLGAILGWAHLLRSEKLDAATTLEAAIAIETSGRAQAALINDLLDVSRIVAGKMELETRALDLASIVDASVQAVQSEAKAKGVCLNQSAASRLPPVLGDPLRLQQVAWNLLSNAIKFTPKGGRVDVQLRVYGSWVELVVRDTGAGISAEFLPHVFERFRQEQNSAARRGGGLGLGMAIVRHLVELHGGTVRAESEGSGHGATFTVRLPLAAIITSDDGATPRAKTNGESVTTLSDLTGLKVHLVDDDVLGRSMTATLLRKCGAAVTESGSAVDALRILRELPPDVLISDIGMPGEDGYSLIRAVRALDSSRRQRTPSVALTAYGSPQDRRLALAAGFDTHLPKPVESAEFVEVVAHLAGRE